MRAYGRVVALVLASCATPPAPPAVSPPPEPVVGAVAIEVDPLPGSVAELERWLAAPSSVEDVPRALLRLATLRLALLRWRDDDEQRSRAIAALVALASEHRAAFLAAGAHRTLAPLLERGQRLALARALACPTRYAYLPTREGGAPAPARVAQDHDQRYWEAWAALHHDPVAHDRRLPLDRRPKATPTTRYDAPSSWADETRYVSPYAACPRSDDPATSELWLMLGEAEDGWYPAGPFQPRRAAEAFRRALDASPPGTPAASMARFRLALAEYRARRPERAFREAVTWLGECESGADCGDAMVATTLVLAADAVTFDDFAGVAEDEPAIKLRDGLDRFTPKDADAAARQAKQRLSDASLLPPGHAFAAALEAEVARTVGVVPRP